VSELTHEDVEQILKIIDGMHDCDVHLEAGALKLHVTRGHGGSQPFATPTANEAQSPRGSPEAVAAPDTNTPPPTYVPSGHVAIRAPTMGTFYRAASPGAKPHAEIGDHVEPDDTVCVFEVMKLFTTLKAGIAGRITAFPVANEAQVEPDQVLVVIKPD
jgi:acetyl-CoA carboxylase biotin carboxyl carrier protein